MIKGHLKQGTSEDGVCNPLQLKANHRKIKKQYMITLRASYIPLKPQ